MDAATLESTLSGFTGTEQYHQWSALYPNFYLTDGVAFLADNAGAYWLMDVIGSYQKKLIKEGEWFQVWKMQVEGQSAVVKCTDGHDRQLVCQKIEYTDFPLSEIKLYASFDGMFLIILLPSEY